mmetsp:Transcript_17416/g.36058  ORF Transcript_17416/g.36058 Transcript_17416/m.36058 type:complete len:804 (-) Transcript_17416:111-2522(-)
MLVLVAPKKPAWGNPQNYKPSSSSSSTTAASGANANENVAKRNGNDSSIRAPSFSEIMNDQSRDRAVARLAYSNDATSTAMDVTGTRIGTVATKSMGVNLSLAEIQAEQERLFASLALQDKQQQLAKPGSSNSGSSSSTALATNTTHNDAYSTISGVDEEERRMIEMAMRQSLEECNNNSNYKDDVGISSTRNEFDLATAPPAAAAAVATAISTVIAPSTSTSTSTTEDAEREMIEAAIREADAMERQQRDFVATSSTDDAKPAAAATKKSFGPEDAEREMIEAAIREADARERNDADAESLRLVMQLQQEELTLARQRQRHQEQTAMTTGNVRTMTRAQLAAETYGGIGMRADADYLHDHDPKSAAAETTGFRMNQQQQHQNQPSEWNRRDRNTIVGPNKEIRTKHDVQLQGQTNASFLDLDVIDDDTGLRTHVGNTAFNAFRKTVAGSYHSKGGHRGTSKGVATYGTGRAGTDSDATKGGALDQHVRLHISKAINAGIIDRCNGIVKQGKEAVVYHAVGGVNTSSNNDSDNNNDNQATQNVDVDNDGYGDGDDQSISDDDSGVSTRNDNTAAKIAIGGNDGYDVAIKVFKRIKEFKGRGEYVDGDPRYAGRPFRSLTDRGQLEVWTEKEFRNLVRAYRAKVPVPNPIHYKENVIFMRFLGEDGWPAPQIREIQMRKGSAKWVALYEQVMESVQRLFRDARLVHGDLSEYNILVAPNSQVDHKSENISSEEDLQTVLIDFGQAVEVRHPKAEELLRRDLSRVKEFFTKRGVTTAMAMSDEEALQFVIDDHSFSINMNMNDEN